MQRLEISGAVRPLYGSLGVKGLISEFVQLWSILGSDTFLEELNKIRKTSM